MNIACGLATILADFYVMKWEPNRRSVLSFQTCRMYFVFSYIVAGEVIFPLPEIGHL